MADDGEVVRPVDGHGDAVRFDPDPELWSEKPISHATPDRAAIDAAAEAIRSTCPVYVDFPRARKMALAALAAARDSMGARSEKVADGNVTPARAALVERERIRAAVKALPTYSADVTRDPRSYARRSESTVILQSVMNILEGGNGRVY